MEKKESIYCKEFSIVFSSG